jgi:hypothetical protein
MFGLAKVVGCIHAHKQKPLHGYPTETTLVEPKSAREYEFASQHNHAHGVKCNFPKFCCKTKVHCPGQFAFLAGCERKTT